MYTECTMSEGEKDTEPVFGIAIDAGEHVTEDGVEGRVEFIGTKSGRKAFEQLLDAAGVEHRTIEEQPLERQSSSSRSFGPPSVWNSSWEPNSIWGKARGQQND